MGFINIAGFTFISEREREGKTGATMDNADFVNNLDQKLFAACLAVRFHEGAEASMPPVTPRFLSSWGKQTSK